MNKIKPCPFCGGEAMVTCKVNYPHVSFNYAAWVTCKKCHSESFFKRGSTREEAIAAATELWNTRKTAANTEVTERWTNSVLCSNEKHEECAKHKSCFYGGDMEEAVRMFGVCNKYRIITQKMEVSNGEEEGG